MDQQDTQADDAGAATDAATINSDAAVLEGVQQPPKRHEDGNPSPPPPQEAEVMNHCSGDPAVAGGITGDAKTGNAEARRRHYRKRALSSATAGTVETLPSTSNGGGNTSDANGLSGLSCLMQNSAVGSNIMSSGVDHSIVSFGLNFNFDNTSSPSNSDSGEGGDTKKKEVAANGSADKKPAAKPTTTNEGTPQAATGSNEDKNSKGSSSNKGPNKTGKTTKKASPSGNGGEDGSDPNSSDSSLNNDSGGSASGGDSNSGSGSGGDGSGGSGWKSTISSLTTSSNQEWLATNESAAAAVTAAETDAVANNATDDAKLSAKKVETGV